MYCAAVVAANTSMRGVEVRHVRRKDVDLDKAWDVESAIGKGVLYVGHSKNETSKRRIPLNGAARDAITRMLKRADELGHTDAEHYLWCANQHHNYDPTKPGKKWDVAWRSLRKAAGLPGFRFHDLRHTVVTDLLEAGEPEHVIQAVTGQLSKKMLEHYSHQRLKAKGQMLERMELRRKKGTAKSIQRRIDDCPAIQSPPPSCLGRCLGQFEVSAINAQAGMTLAHPFLPVSGGGRPSTRNSHGSRGLAVADAELSSLALTAMPRDSGVSVAAGRAPAFAAGRAPASSISPGDFAGS